MVHGPRGCHFNGYISSEFLASNTRSKFWLFYAEIEIIEGYVAGTEPLGGSSGEITGAETELCCRTYQADIIRPALVVTALPVNCQ